MTPEVKELPTNEVYPNPNQPRQHFDEGSLKELADSIKEQGQIQPILVRPNGEGFIIVHGERRWRAIQLAELPTIRAEVREDLTEAEAYTISVIENEQREDISPIETANALHRMMADQELTQSQVAHKISRSRTWVAQKLCLLNLPGEVQELVKADNLTEAHARQLLKLKTAGLNSKIQEIASEASENNWSVSEIQNRVDVTIAGGVSQDTRFELSQQFKTLDDFIKFYTKADQDLQRQIYNWLIREGGQS